MTVTVRHALDVATGFRSSEAGMWMKALDDQHGLLLSDIESITTAELEWQPRPGTNTIGMLLAHIAVVEVFWTQVGPERKSKFETDSILGIGIDDDGMPAPEDGLPPAGLAGKSLSFYRDLLVKARAYANQAVAGLDETDLEPLFMRTRRNGTVEELNVRWVLYHMVEHFSGHYGQILLLRHQYRDAHRR